MRLPRENELYAPVLEALRDSGKTLERQELIQRVRERYSDLPEALLEERYKVSGENRLNSCINWAISKLKMGQFVCFPVRGKVEITDKGRAAAQRGTLTWQDICNDPDFIAYNSARKRRQADESESEEETVSDLDSSPQGRIEEAISYIESTVQDALLDKLKSVEPYAFEHIVLRLFEKMGYGDWKSTPKTGDGGIDGIIHQDQLGFEKIYVQAKRYSDNPVREPEMRNFIGAMGGDTDKGIFVTTSRFNDSARQKASGSGKTVILIDGAQLVELMYQYNVGVQVRDTYKTKVLDEDFFDLS